MGATGAPAVAAATMPLPERGTLYENAFLHLLGNAATPNKCAYKDRTDERNEVERT